MSNSGLIVFYGAEPVVLVIALLVLWRSRETKQFPALLVYLLTRLISDLAMTFSLLARTSFGVTPRLAYACYFWTFWASYIAGSIAVFFVLFELFQKAMDPLPAVRRMGSIVFRWIVGISVVAAIAAVAMPSAPSGYQLLLTTCNQIMRSESIFTLCLLSFLMLAGKKLGLSYKSRVFGIGFGFGVMGACNLVTAAFRLGSTSQMWRSSASFMATAASLVALAIWIVYLVREEPVRLPATQRNVSSLARWNEIAASFGYAASQPAAAPASSGRDLFLHDVEKVVDRVLVKNSLHMTG